MQAVCRWIAGRYSTDKAKRGISKEQIASDTRLSDTGVLELKIVESRYASLRFVSCGRSVVGMVEKDESCTQLSVPS